MGCARRVVAGAVCCTMMVTLATSTFSMDVLREVSMVAGEDTRGVGDWDHWRGPGPAFDDGVTILNLLTGGDAVSWARSSYEREFRYWPGKKRSVKDTYALLGWLQASPQTLAEHYDPRWCNIHGKEQASTVPGPQPKQLGERLYHPCHNKQDAVRYARVYDWKRMMPGHVRRGTNADPLPPPKEWTAGYCEGDSLVFLQASFRSIEHMRLERALTAVLFPAAVGMNVYVSPPDTRGFEIHQDRHCVFIVQVEGRKEWHIYDYLAEELPRVEHSYPVKKPPPLLHRMVLRAGDVLYIPRGMMHEAQTLPGQHSVHVTLSLDLFRTSWEDAVHSMLHLLCAYEPSDSRSGQQQPDDEFLRACVDWGAYIHSGIHALSNELLVLRHNAFLAEIPQRMQTMGLGGSNATFVSEAVVDAAARLLDDLEAQLDFDAAVATKYEADVVAEAGAGGYLGELKESKEDYYLEDTIKWAKRLSKLMRGYRPDAAETLSIGAIAHAGTEFQRVWRTVLLPLMRTNLRDGLQYFWEQAVHPVAGVPRLSRRAVADAARLRYLHIPQRHPLTCPAAAIPTSINPTADLDHAWCANRRRTADHTLEHHEEQTHQTHQEHQEL